MKQDVQRGHVVFFQRDPNGKITVKAKYFDGTTYEGKFDTVIFAVGREAETAKLGLEKVTLKLGNNKNKQTPKDTKMKKRISGVATNVV